MTLRPRSEIDLKPHTPQGNQEREIALCDRLADALKGESYRSISKLTGYHAETVRRYLRGESKIPADFVGQIYRTHNHIDVFAILGFELPHPSDHLRHIPTHLLINELAQRFKLIEDATVSNIVLRDMLEPAGMNA